ncbi:MAG: hypothetical protein KDC53_23980, partial [Saprospiraceae bacterium]|nr:hypothetical protein [Saprospiraceae bacterium]
GLTPGGQYKFKVKSECSSGSSDHSPWFSFATAPEINQNIISIKAFPNPVNNFLTISLGIDEFKGEIIGKMVDFTGRTVWSQSFAPSDLKDFQIPVAHLRDGFYQLQLWSKEQIANVRIFIHH